MGEVKLNPLHFVIGLLEIGIGLHLIIHDSYFRWPPFFVGIANDDIVGFVFVLVGVLMLLWVFDEDRSTRMNHVLLVTSSSIMALLATYQFLHFIFLGIDMPWVSNAAITAVIVILARRSDSV